MLTPTRLGMSRFVPVFRDNWRKVFCHEFKTLIIWIPGAINMRLPLLLLVTALITACGGGDGSTEPTPMTPPPLSASVTTAALSETGPFVFRPQDVEVGVGGSVTWSVPGAAGTILHSVTADSGAWAADTLAANETLSIVFRNPGEFRYHCVFHDGMVGKVTVQ